MSTSGEILERIQARQRLEEINHFVLGDAGEIREAPGKLSLVWDDGREDAAGERRFIAIKVSVGEQMLVNGRRYPATEEGLKAALRESLRENAAR